MILDNDDRKNIVLSGLANGPGVHLVFDSRCEGVALPEKYMGQAKVVIEIGLNMPVPIPDLVVDADGVRGTLSFDRAPFAVVLPWACIYGVHGVFALPLRDAPEDAQLDVPAPAPAPAPTATGRPKLTLVE